VKRAGPPHRPVLPAALAALLAMSLSMSGALAAAPEAAAAEHDWSMQAETGGGIDTNPSRVATSEGPAALVLGQVRARDRVAGDGWGAQADLTAGARLYLDAPGATALASRLEASGQAGLGGPLTAGASLLASDLSEADGLLDGDVLRGNLSLHLGRPGWGASLAAGWLALLPRAADLRAFGSSGPEGWLRGTLAPRPGHQLSAGLGFAFASFPRWQAPGREDTAWTLEAGYGYRGGLVADLRYAFTASRSTVDGGAFDRHQLRGRAALFLRGDWTLALRAALQRSRYPAPLYLLQQLRLPSGDEGQDLVEGRLAIPLGASSELRLSLARSWGETVPGASSPVVGRTLATLSVAWREGAE
jgi:hypothetical protein